ncbi:hypothetical protein D9758_002774 [Tetrapyrgos nigripes]|uniref:ABM domain-containing protein n=1 Tax=Tetrapyrgos nigripes TaxID=182062 RepID=A0A8H5GR70_9AGAR|nr:hypothetical protein D9758_002774 [Tetrapyrgos nigripes]
MTIVEIFTFDATDAYVADPAGTWKDLKDSHSGLNGLLNFHHGPHVENASKGSCLVTWDKVESFEAVTSESRQSARTQAFSLAVKGNSQLQLFDIGTADITKITGAPVTELTVMKVKEGKTKADLNSIFEGLKKASEPLKACHGFEVGWSTKKGEEGTFLVLMGWDSMEDHLNSIQNVPDYSAISQASASLVDFVSMHHAKLAPVGL